MGRIPRLPLAAGAFQRTPGRCTKRIVSGLASCRNWKLGTTFRSLVTTLSPPLRGRRSRPAPSIPHNSPALTRSISGSPLSSVSKPKPGEFLTFNPLPTPDYRALATVRHPHSPLGRFNPPDQSVQRHHYKKLASQDTRLPSAPRNASLSMALRINARNSASSRLAIAGNEPASFSASPGLLRAQLAVLFSAPAITQASRRRAQPLFDVPPSPAAGSGSNPSS